MTRNIRMEQYVRDGEDFLCHVGAAILGGDDASVQSHAAWHRRSQVVMDAAIQSSKRGDGRFIDGPASPVLGMTTALDQLGGAVARATKAIGQVLGMARCYAQGPGTHLGGNRWAGPWFQCTLQRGHSGRHEWGTDNQVPEAEPFA